MRAIALALLVPALALAQHHSTTIVPAAQDPDRRAHMPNGVAITPAPGETMDHASMHAIPLGTGAAPDGSAWLRPDVTGIYTLHNVELVILPGVKPPFHALLYAGQIYRVLPHKGAAQWTLPSQKTKQVIPAINLLAPTPRKP